MFAMDSYSVVTRHLQTAYNVSPPKVLGWDGSQSITRYLFATEPRLTRTALAAARPGGQMGVVTIKAESDVPWPIGWWASLITSQRVTLPPRMCVCGLGFAAARSLLDTVHPSDNNSSLTTHHVEIRSLEQSREPPHARSLAVTASLESGLESAPGSTTWSSATALTPDVVAESRVLGQCVNNQSHQLYEGPESTGPRAQACGHRPDPPGYPGPVGRARGDPGGAVEGGD